MDRQKSIYDCILEGIKDGKLEEGFSLPELEAENGIRFADGAMDGITYYHMGRSHIDEAGTDLMIKALKHTAAGDYENADTAFAELSGQFRAISIIDDVQGYIIEHTDELPAENVFQTALYLITNSKDRESVKFGLSILELFKVNEESVKEVIRNIGLSDEFTIFAVWNMLKWDNANEEVFNLIRKVRGWGRVHALEKLEPETPEIGEWILLNGLDNDVMASYSALTVWEKADVEKRLQEQINQDEFRAIGNLFIALLDEGPVPGISEIENAETYILKYLSMTETFAMERDDYQNIEQLENWSSEEETNIPAVYAKCHEILSSEEAKKA